IDFSGGIILVPITFHGGDGGFDSLVIVGGSFSEASYSASGPDSGRIILDGTIIDYTGLEPITDDNIVDDRVFMINTSGVDQQIRIGDDSDPNNGYSTIDSNGTGGFESITFLNPANSLTVYSGDGNDTIILDTPDNGFAAPIIIDGQAGDDTLIGPDGSSTWNITGENAGTLNDQIFIDIENLIGAADNEDTFVFKAAGSISGVVEGGDGGFDIIVLDEGGFDTITYNFAGPDSGSIIRDSDVITYSGFEPLSTVPDSIGPNPTDVILNYNVSVEQTLTIQAGPPGQTTVQSNAAEVATFNNPSASLTINAGSAADIIVIESLDDGFGAALIISGQDGIDTLVGPNAPNTWAITGTNAGDLTSSLANLTNISVTASFTEVENLTGGSDTDSFTFGEDGGVTGTIDDGAGTVELTLGGFVTLSGNYSFVKSSKTFILNNGDSVTADFLTVGASSGTVFAGVGGDTTNPIGFNANLDEFALAIITELGGSNRAWHAVTGTLSSVSFSGIDGLTIEATSFVLNVNTAAGDGTVVDFNAGGS
ncbi:MAG: hypothetical protein KAT58_08040, partial [candidate division Zixibacteria bacterium]|nr:hypothetical protein [candidate division Zixibacteria bacterium]